MKALLLQKNLTPSDTAQLNKEFVQGFATNIGGTSHSAIIESFFRNSSNCWYKINYSRS
ncbi:PEP-utilizing enzyme [Staphylococcus aureus]